LVKHGPGQEKKGDHWSRGGSKPKNKTNPRDGITTVWRRDKKEKNIYEVAAMNDEVRSIKAGKAGNLPESKD